MATTSRGKMRQNCGILISSIFETSNMKPFKENVNVIFIAQPK